MGKVISLPSRHLGKTAMLKEVMSRYKPKGSPSLEDLVRELKEWPETPDLLSNGYEFDGVLWMKTDQVLHWPYWPSPLPSYAMMSGSYLQGVRTLIYDPPPPAEDDPPFEVNLTEALVGWRAWLVDGDGIWSVNRVQRWTPLKPLEAACAPGFGEDHHPPPFVRELCSCGIYAVDRREDLETDGQTRPLIGQVYGWGRYVRGDNGWRTQFAYPKSFHLQPGQGNLLPVLKKYKVPIYEDRPTQVYFPEEEGYDEYRQDYPSWNRGTAEGAGAAEDREDEQDWEEGDED